MRITHRVFSGILAVFALVSCAVAPSAGSSESPPETQRRPSKQAPAPVELPPEYGVFFESPTGLRSLMDTATVPPTSLTFIVYLETLPPADKLILRFGRDAGRDFFVVKSGELAGVFDAKMSPVAGRPEVYRATYRGDLKPGKYVAYTFTDVSKGTEPWAEAQFQYAGQIEVGP